MGKARIGIIRDTFFTNEPRGLNIAKALVAEGYQVIVLCFGEKNCVEMFEGITIHRFKMNQSLKGKIYPFMEVLPLYKWIWRRQVRNFLKQYRPQLLQVHDLYMLGPVLPYKEKFNLKVTLNMHENYVAAVNNYPWAQSKILSVLTNVQKWKKLESKYLKSVEHIFVVCQEFKDVLLTRLPFLSQNQVTVYPNVPSLKEFESYKVDPAVYVKKDDEFLLFYFGVIAKRRGIFDCLEALRELSDNPQIKLLVIGPIDKKDRAEFEDRVNRYALKDRVTYIPWVDISKLPSYLFHADLCLSPLEKSDQHDTTYANKVFQYMLFKKMVLLSDVLPQKNLIEETGAGITHEANNPTDLAEKIRSLSLNKNAFSQYQEDGYIAVNNKYNSEYFVKDVICTYTLILRGQF